MRDKVARQQLFELVGTPANVKMLENRYWELRQELEILKRHLGIKIIDVPNHKEVKEIGEEGIWRKTLCQRCRGARSAAKGVV